MPPLPRPPSLRLLKSRDVAIEGTLGFTSRRLRPAPSQRPRIHRLRAGRKSSRKQAVEKPRKSFWGWEVGVLGEKGPLEALSLQIQSWGKISPNT